MNIQKAFNKQSEGTGMKSGDVQQSETESASDAEELEGMLDAHRERVANAIASALRHSDALCIRANPGCGLTPALKLLKDTGSDQGFHVIYRTFQGRSSRSCAGEITKEDQKMPVGGLAATTVLVLDRLPAFTETESIRFGKAFRLFVRHGGKIVCAFREEGVEPSGLGEDVAWEDAHDACFAAYERKSWKGGIAFDEALRISAGMPSLMRALWTFHAEPDGLLSDGDALCFAHEADAAVMTEASALSKEAREAFSCMLLFGTGTLKELEGILGDDAGADAVRVSSYIPLVVLEGDSWTCGCTQDVRVLAHMDRFLGTLDVMDEQEGLLCILALEKRLLFQRAAILAAHMKLGRQAAAHIVLEGAHYLDAGEAKAVEKALREAGATRNKKEGLSAACGLKLVSEPRTKALQTWRQRVGVQKRTKDTSLSAYEGIWRIRQSFGDRAGRLQELADGSDDGFALHCALWKALLEGEAPDIPSAALPGETGLLSEVAEADVAFFREVLLGKRSIWPRVADSRLDIGALWVRTLQAAALAMGPAASGPGELGRLASYWSEREDALPQLVSGIAGGAAALRQGSAAHAHVFLAHAERAAEELSSMPLLDEIHLLQATEIGGMTARGVARRLGKAKSAEGRLMARAVRCAAQGTKLNDQDLPLQLRWILALLLGMPQSFSSQIGDAVPEGWKRDVALWQEEAHPKKREERREESLRVEPVSLAGDVPGLLEISLLGRFEVKVDGEPILLNRWPRRSSKALLQMLAAKRGHTMRRADVLAALWPESNYVEGRPKIYSAVSTLREVVRQKGTGARFIVGGDGLISLNPASVICDVDAFEALVKEVLAEATGTERALEAADEILDIYQGEMIVASQDSSGMMVRRAEELRQEYVDALSKAAQIALDESSLSAAALYARSACRELPTREDAAIVLIRVYLRQGRTADAWEAYQSFSQQLMDDSGIYPSGRMRALMDDALREAGAQGADRGRHPSLESD